MDMLIFIHPEKGHGEQRCFIGLSILRHRQAPGPKIEPTLPQSAPPRRLPELFSAFSNGLQGRRMRSIFSWDSSAVTCQGMESAGAGMAVLRMRISVMHNINGAAAAWKWGCCYAWHARQADSTARNEQNRNCVKPRLQSFRCKVNALERRYKILRLKCYNIVTYAVF